MMMKSENTIPAVSSSVRSLISSRTSRTGRSTRSLKPSKLDRFKRPLLESAYCTDLQNGSMITGMYSIILSWLTVIISVFDIYCLAMAEPGVTHYGYYVFSFEFVYVGNLHVRNFLIILAIINIIFGFTLMVTSVLLLIGVLKEQERKFVPWLYSMAGFTIFRLFATIFSAIVNDLIYNYHIAMLLIWLILICCNVFLWLVTYSLYMQLCDLTRLEDLAKFKLGTMSSLNASLSHHSVSLSMGGISSRPTTPGESLSTSGIV